MMSTNTGVLHSLSWCSISHFHSEALKGWLSAIYSLILTPYSRNMDSQWFLDRTVSAAVRLIWWWWKIKLVRWIHEDRTTSKLLTLWSSLPKVLARRPRVVDMYWSQETRCPGFRMLTLSFPSWSSRRTNFFDFGFRTLCFANWHASHLMATDRARKRDCFEVGLCDDDVRRVDR